MNKISKIFLVFVIIILFVIIGFSLYRNQKSRSCEDTCRQQNPEVCPPNIIGCPYAACAYSCNFICLPIPGLSGGPLCI